MCDRRSPVNFRRLLSSSLDGHIQQWNVDGHESGTFHQEAGGADYLAFALEGTRFVSCGGSVATVRDSEPGAAVVRFKGLGGPPLDPCCFSPDGRFIACAEGLRIYVWDVTDSEAHRMLDKLSENSLIDLVDWI